MATGVVSWSQVAASNGNSDANINFLEGMAASQVDDSCRAMMASIAKYRDDNTGSLVTGGSGTAYTITTNQGFTSLAEMDKQEFALFISVVNGANPTLSVDGLTAKPIYIDLSNPIPANTLRANCIYKFNYSNGQGKFLLQGYRPLQIFTQIFSSSGTYTPNALMQFALVRLIGGGGGGGGAAASPSGLSSGGGGDGGGGAEVVLTATQIGASQTVTIGGAGSAGSAGNNQGGTGGTTSLGALVSATGGTGGTGGSANNNGVGGGSPGVGSGSGAVILNGGSGSPGGSASIITVNTLSGIGGAAPYFSAPTPGLSIGNASAQAGFGGTFGAGGGGGQSHGSNSAAAGGPGGAGLMVIVEFCY